MDLKMKKLGIIGASYLQEPLIQTAKNMGIETHVFAWACDDVGEKSADYFYPISIIEKDQVLEQCRRIGIDGICTIASDLAAVTVNYVANQMGLIGNTPECTLVSTNKHEMRKCFETHGDPSPKSRLVVSADEVDTKQLSFPIIVKPIDRSGSRGITKLASAQGLEAAIEIAKEQGFEKKALVEEFAEGQEYSVEYISWKGTHHFLALTKKFTTGAPHFIETGHIEPAPVDEKTLERVKSVVEHALTSLGVAYGASHSEIKISETGAIKIIEIGARMGGDFIGSHLVKLSTGVDFVRLVVQTALGIEPIVERTCKKVAAVRFILGLKDVEAYQELKANHPEVLVDADVHFVPGQTVTDSSSRFGYFLMCSDDPHVLEEYLPEEQ